MLFKQASMVGLKLTVNALTKETLLKSVSRMFFNVVNSIFVKLTTEWLPCVSSNHTYYLIIYDICNKPKNYYTIKLFLKL